MYSSEAFAFFGLDAGTASLAEVKRAYATRLKVTRPEDDPKAFMELRAALETALSHVNWRETYGSYEYEDDDENEDDVAETAGNAAAETETDHEAAYAAELAARREAASEVDRDDQPVDRRVDRHPSLTERTPPQPAVLGPLLPVQIPLTEQRGGPGADFGDPYTDEYAQPDPAPRPADRHPAISGRTHPSLAEPTAETLPDAAAETENLYTDDSAFEDAPEAAVDRIMSLLIDTLTSPWGAASLRKLKVILDEPDVAGIDEYQELSERLRTFLCDRSGMFLDGNKTPMVPPWLTRDVLDLFELQFGWTRQLTSAPWEHAQNAWILRMMQMQGAVNNLPRPPQANIGTAHPANPYVKASATGGGNVLWIILAVIVGARIIGAFFN
jgi:hypothetical protein